MLIKQLKVLNQYLINRLQKNQPTIINKKENFNYLKCLEKIVQQMLKNKIMANKHFKIIFDILILLFLDYNIKSAYLFENII